jgi:predicted  nucleic acid-binding Zn-ribbon protein
MEFYIICVHCGHKNLRNGKDLKSFCDKCGRYIFNYEVKKQTQKTAQAEN